jgi:hypothetical protein
MTQGNVPRLLVGDGRSRALRARLAQLPTRNEARRFAEASRSSERGSAWRAVRDGMLVTVTLRQRGVRPLLPPQADGETRLDLERASRVSTAVDAGLGMLPVAATCLRRSLVLMRELRRLGLFSTLHVGVRQSEGRSEAHAWVEVSGVVINDDPHLTATYAELASGDLERLLPLLP